MILCQLGGMAPVTPPFPTPLSGVSVWLVASCTICPSLSRTRVEQRGGYTPGYNRVPVIRLSVVESDRDEYFGLFCLFVV